MTLTSKKVINESLNNGEIKILSSKINYTSKFSYILSPNKKTTKSINLFIEILNAPEDIEV